MGKLLDQELKINREIRSQEVRLVGDNVEIGVYSLKEALQLSKDLEVDLIEINPVAVPPVCILQDYNKFLYNKKKKQKDLDKKNKSNKIEIKEMRMTPNIDDHDYNFKKNHIINFIKEGNKVKTFVFFKGREIIFKDKGEILLLKLAEELSDIAVPESLPKLEGNKMSFTLKPKK